MVKGGGAPKPPHSWLVHPMNESFRQACHPVLQHRMMIVCEWAVATYGKYICFGSVFHQSISNTFHRGYGCPDRLVSFAANEYNIRAGVEFEKYPVRSPEATANIPRPKDCLCGHCYAVVPVMFEQFMVNPPDPNDVYVVCNG